jgi:hypothetical protein
VNADSAYAGVPYRVYEDIRTDGFISFDCCHNTYINTLVYLGQRIGFGLELSDSFIELVCVAIS